MNICTQIPASGDKGDHGTQKKKQPLNYFYHMTSAHTGKNSYTQISLSIHTFRATGGKKKERVCAGVSLL